MYIQELPIEVQTPDSIESLVVIVFSTVAALFSIFLEKRRKNKKNSDSSDTHTISQADKFLERAFEELQKTTELLRDENRTLMEYNAKLGRVIDHYRDLYKGQVESNSDMIIASQDHLEEIEDLNMKMDYLINAIREEVCDDDCDLDIG